MIIACHQSDDNREVRYDEVNITETVKARTCVSLAQKTDGMLSGPEERVCLELSKALVTTGTEKDSF